MAVAGEVSRRIQTAAKIGTYFLVAPDGSAVTGMELAQRLVDALTADPRVTTATLPDLQEDFTQFRKLWPDMARSGARHLLAADDGLNCLTLSDPLIVKVHVPKKNQPKRFDFDELSTEDYTIAWDGLTAVVVWEQRGDIASLAAGHVVLEILSDAATSIGCAVYRQSCSPECESPFMHFTLWLSPAKQGSGSLVSSDAAAAFRRRGRFDIDADVDSDDGDLAEMAHSLWYQIEIPLDLFAEAKNYGRRLIDLEGKARQDLGHLLQHQYDHARLRSLPWRQSVKGRWKVRGWRRETRQLIVGIWLALAHLESLSRAWQLSRSQFERHAELEQVRMLFDAEDSDLVSVQSLDIAHIEATVGQIAQGADNKVVAIATAGGAISGGVVGALATLIH